MEQEEHNIYNGRWWSVGDGGADGAEHKEWLALVDSPCILKK